MKLTTEQIEELAIAIRQFLIDNKLWIDVCIYFNGKAFSTNDRENHFYYNDPDHLVVLEDENPHDHFKYVAEPHILSMSFEGDFCGCLNYYNEHGAAFDDRIQTEFSAILSRYGLYYELGDHWNLSCYPITPDEEYTQSEPTAGSKDSPIRFYGSSPDDSIVPDKLLEIQQVWKEKADAYGDVGSCVMGAGFSFNYQGVWYKMPPTACRQGSCSWEHCIEEIEALLKEAGATEITYEWGVMD